jgi:hypothetical protein
VQLFRNRRKILSAWASRPRYRLKLRWSHGGERRRLAPGRYRWAVWPGFGPRSRAATAGGWGPTRSRCCLPAPSVQRRRAGTLSIGEADRVHPGSAGVPGVETTDIGLLSPATVI